MEANELNHVLKHNEATLTYLLLEATSWSALNHYLCLDFHVQTPSGTRFGTVPSAKGRRKGNTRSPLADHI